MFVRLRWKGTAAAGVGLFGLALATGASSQPPPPKPRPGLTAAQTKEAVGLAQGAMRELRKKTEGASAPGADVREYFVGVELLAPREAAPAEGDTASKTKPDDESNADQKEKAKDKAKPSGPLAVVTSYRYFDDITVFSTIDLDTGKVVHVEAAEHIPTPLSDGEYEEAITLAREKSDEVQRLYERFGKELTVYPQFSQFAVKDDPRRHRVVHMNYRVGKRDLSYPRPQVDLTTREVVVPAPEADPKAPARRRGTN